VAHAFHEVGEAANSADLVMLPELWHVGAFDISAAREHAQPIDGPLVTDLGALAKQHGVWLHGGSFTELADDGKYYNTSVLFDPTGALVASYRKIHLFGFDGGETLLMSAGDELVVVDTPLGPTGLATCYDLRFPEMFRVMMQGGATAFLLTSGWPSPRIAHWDVLVRARAIENQAWMLACNEVGEQPGVSLGGHSVVVDPKGEAIAELGNRAGVLKATVDPDEAGRWRAAFPATGDVRLL
jgi:predicted amidohydrolase